MAVKKTTAAPAAVHIPDISVGMAALKRQRAEMDAIITAVEQIDQIGGINRVAEEAEARRERALQSEAAVQEDISRARETLAGINKDIEAKTAEAAGIKAEAKQEAGRITAEASSKAGDIIRSAKEQAQGIADSLSKTRGELAAAEAKLADLNKQIDTAEKSRAALLRKLGD